MYHLKGKKKNTAITGEKEMQRQPSPAMCKSKKGLAGEPQVSHKRGKRAPGPVKVVIRGGNMKGKGTHL